MSRFVKMLQTNLLATHNIGWGIDYSFIFSLLCASIHIKSSLPLLFFLQIKIKSQSFKNLDFAPFEKNYSFLPTLAHFCKIF